MRKNVGLVQFNWHIYWTQLGTIPQPNTSGSVLFYRWFGPVPSIDRLIPSQTNLFNIFICKYLLYMTREVGPPKINLGDIINLYSLITEWILKGWTNYTYISIYIIHEVLGPTSPWKILRPSWTNAAGAPSTVDAAMRSSREHNLQSTGLWHRQGVITPHHGNRQNTA